MSAPKRAILTGLLICGVLIGGGWYFLDRLIWGDADYSKDPPNRLFRSIVGLDIPPGVTDLLFAGRAGPLGLKSWVWMRFHYTDKNLPALLDSKSLMTEESGRRSLVLPDMPMHRVREDRRGWDVRSGQPEESFRLSAVNLPVVLTRQGQGEPDDEPRKGSAQSRGARSVGTVAGGAD